MQQTDNIWIESWQLATPLPAYKQKRLFDDTREAEKVLHYLEKLHPSELALATLPILLDHSIRCLRAKLGEKEGGEGGRREEGGRRGKGRRGREEREGAVFAVLVVITSLYSTNGHYLIMQY